ncbi:hypothetical protein ACFYY5_29450 [Nocardia elegans]|uniref:Uncharacterized protein n=1 Tax=Nocardia elegans TaxID=300029 RepID=A0ABW6TLH5_9NOCA
MTNIGNHAYDELMRERNEAREKVNSLTVELGRAEEQLHDNADRIAELWKLLMQARDELRTVAEQYAIIHVEPKPGSHAWPVVERVEGGWQSGAHHYRDREVLDISRIVEVDLNGE